MPPTQLMQSALRRTITHTTRQRSMLRNAIILGLLLVGSSACAGSRPQTIQADDGVTTAQLETNDSTLEKHDALGDQRTLAIGGGTTGVMLDLEDSVWLGGYRGPNNGAYGGRTATLMYGTSTKFNTIQATFLVEARPFGIAELNVEGLDAAGSDKTPIAIVVNGQEIYNGPNQLPDDSSFETKSWGSYTWTFNAQILQPGHNTVSITNLALGTISEPPFLILDYAQITYEEQ